MIADELRAARPLVEIMAAERCKDRPDLFQDAVQEGLIALWRVSETHPDASDRYRRACARNAVANVLRGRPLTGQASRRGWQDAATTAVPVDPTMPDPAYVEPGFARVETDSETSFLREAVAGLPDRQREYVVLRFWGGMSDAEIAAALGTTASAMHHVWRAARKNLRDGACASV